MDLTGNRYGNLIVTGITDRKQYGYKVWKCLCDCGNTKEVMTSSLTSNSTTSCGCKLRNNMSKLGKRTAKNITNNSYGFLTALNPTDKRNSSGSIKWRCLCVCGTYTYVPLSELNRLSILSCGCMGKGVQYVYALRAITSGLIKIGISSNIIQRMKHIQKDIQEDVIVLGIRLGTKQDESAIHQKLTTYKAIHPKYTKGKEWFIPSAYVMETVQNDIISVAV